MARKNRLTVPDVPRPTETITPANDTPVGQTIDGYPLYERADGSRYRVRDGRPEFGGDLCPWPRPRTRPQENSNA